jgi:sulfur carrier protein
MLDAGGAVGLPERPLRCKGEVRRLASLAVVVSLNGERHALSDGLTVGRLVTQLGLSARRVAVEVNREIVPRDAYDTHALTEGDTIEIVHFVGGG